MTHHSTFRYGLARREALTSCRGSSEVRVRYFDPATGEPCAEKPEPLKVKRKRPDAKKTADERMEAIQEAERIMAEMRARKRKPLCGKFPHKNGRAVLVDGERFPSISAAARSLGVDGNYLGKRLREGASCVYGSRVEFAEVEE